MFTHPDDRPTLAELGEPVPLPPHGPRPWSCHEGDCRRCAIEQARDEAEYEAEELALEQAREDSWEDR